VRKPKVLIIPAWYPTNRSPTVGSFCQEQTELLQFNYDQRVLYPRITQVGKINTFKRIFKRRVVETSGLLGLIPGNEVHVFTSTFRSFQNRMKFASIAFLTVLKRWTEDGWFPDLIHAHGTEPAGIIAELISKRLNLPFIITEHKSILASDFDRNIWSLYRQAQESAKKVLTVSNEVSKMILMNDVNCDPQIVGNLVNEILFPLKGYQSNSNLFKILFIAVPAKTKDIPCFLKSLKQLKQTASRSFRATMVIPDIKADLSIEEILAMCQEMEISDVCDFKGNLPRVEISKLLRESDVLVSTSITETFGLSVAEAIVSGVPVIATRSGGVEDFVNDKNGCLINIRDFCVLAGRLLEIMNGEIFIDPVAARSAMVQQSGTEAFTARISNIYQEVLAM
jgi:glycosyltransferase involved in cell wall biosynthesis